MRVCDTSLGAGRVGGPRCPSRCARRALRSRHSALRVTVCWLPALRRLAADAARAPAAAGAVRRRPAAHRVCGSASRGAACAAWQRLHDGASGRDYFWNTETQQTAWELPAGAGVGDDTEAPAGPSNAQLCVLFLDYILTPQALFDYPSPSAEFMVRCPRALHNDAACEQACVVSQELVEANRGAIYERQDNFYAYLSDEIDATPAGGPPVTRSADAVALPVEATRRVQSAAAAGIAMFADDNMRWNKQAVLTRREALESVRARLSSPALRDANPAF
jgi:hypothetical protein